MLYILQHEKNAEFLQQAQMSKILNEMKYALQFYSTKKTLKSLFDHTDHSLDQMHWPDSFMRYKIEATVGVEVWPVIVRPPTNAGGPGPWNRLVEMILAKL